MPLRIEAGWEPVQLRGNYLYWKKIGTGETRKSYISDGQLPEIQRDLAKYRKLRSGLGYPWQPVKYEGGYVYYQSLKSEETTKSFVPPEMRAWANAFFSNIKPVTPGKAKVITLTPTGKAQYSYISRGNYTELRESLSVREQQLMPYASEKYTKRIGVVEKVLAGNLIVVDGVVIKVKNAQTPQFKEDEYKWLQAKNYTETLVLNRFVVLKIDLNAPTDQQGTTIAEVLLEGERNYLPKEKKINLSVPWQPKRGESALYGGDVPLYNVTFGGFKKEVPYDASLSNFIIGAGYAPTYDEIEAKRIQEEMLKIAARTQFTTGLMQNQTALPPAMRDRPNEWGTLDKILFPLMAMSWGAGAEIRNIAVYRQTGKYGSYSWRDRLTPSDTSTFIRATKVLLGQTVDAKRFEDKGSKWAWREYGKAPQDTWEGGFWDRLTTDIGTDFTNLVQFGIPAFSSSIKLSSGKRFFITPEGIEIYNQLATKYGAKEARHVFTRMLKENPEIARIAAWSNGVRIAFTNFEVVPAKYSTDIINAVTSTMWKYGVSKPFIQPITHTMEMASPLVQILKNRLSGNKPIEYSTFNHLLGDLRTEIRIQSQLVKSEIYSLQQEAQVALGKGYANIVTKLVEDETLRAKYPQLKPIIDEIIKRNYNIAALEQTWGLLDKMRNNYIFHTWTKAAREAMEEGALKLPPKSLAASSDKNIVEVMGQVLNPYNYARVYGDTITQINEWSMKNNGFPLLVENAFDIQKTREQMHVTSVAVMKFLDNIGRDYGEPLSMRVKGYAVSKIPQLQNVQLPKELLRIIESDELIRSRIPELTQPGKLMRIVQASDTMQAIWKFSVTSIEASWYTANIQSGLFVNVWFAGARKFNSYKDAWIELARGNELLNKAFKMAKTGGTFKDIYGEEHTAAELIEEARKLNILGQEGALDISRHFKPKTDTIMDMVATGAKWATKASENVVRFPLYMHLRLNKGMSAEEAAKIVEHFHFNYAKAGLSQAEQQVATRLFNFYVWYKNVPKLMAYTYVHTPSAISIPYKVMNIWNGEQGGVEKQYFTERQLARMMFKIPNTDAYVNPAPFSLMNAFYKWGYMLKSTEGGFYWDELKKDPELLTRFIKNELDVDWLNRGGGKVTVQGDKAVIEYMETGDTITARLDANQSKLVFVDDATGEVLKEYPTKNIDGKIGITKDTRPLEKIMGEIGARTLMMPIELALGRDFKFGSPIENPAWWLVNQFTGTSGRAIEEVFDPTINPIEKVAELLFGWFVDHLRDNRMVPKQDLTESAVKKVMDIEVWKIERGDYLGCGF